ncbi:MAG: hypothetical protein HQ478_01690 [Chloroflexi bacterium]|nr:hypothetical protein [Chloroflexota bacterium]
MQILAIGTLKEGVTPDKTRPHGADEVKHTLEAYLDGKIRNFWFQVNRPGMVLILECTDEDEARHVMEELPLVAAGLLDVDLIPLQPLLPLGTLIGREFSP